MALVQPFIVAAFVLYGVLFLLPVDPVNSLICKNCTSGDAVCENGRSAINETCSSDQKYCIIITVAMSNGRSGKFRRCNAAERTGCREIMIENVSSTVCYQSCTFDICNVDKTQG